MRPEFRITHAVKMLRRNLRSYAMLSITLVFSFGVLLGYFLFSDSQGYNDFKEIFSSPREIVMAYARSEDARELQVLKQQVAEQLPGTGAYLFFDVSTRLPQYGDVLANVSVLPGQASIVFREISDDVIYENYTVPVTVVQGQTFPLRGNQAVINRSFFHSLSPSQTLPLTLEIPFYMADGTQILREVQVVGVCEDISEEGPFYSAEGKLCGQTQIYVSQALFSREELPQLTQRKPLLLIRSPEPEKAAAYAKQFDLVLHAVCMAQNAATEALHRQAKNKALIALVLYALLCLNLYGCFSNALSDRRYEIGIKRALGAGKGTIVGQFFTEGIMVMLGSVLLAVLLIAGVAAVYKLYQLFVSGKQWILCLRPYSLGMFLVSSVGMSLLLSLLFAFRATQTEIAAQLKSE